MRDCATFLALQRAFLSLPAEERADFLQWADSMAEEPEPGPPSDAATNEELNWQALFHLAAALGVPAHGFVRAEDSDPASRPAPRRRRAKRGRPTGRREDPEGE